MGFKQCVPKRGLTMNWYNKIIIASMRAYTVRDFLDIMKEDFGVQFIRKGNGSHEIWGYPGGKTVGISVAPLSKILNPVTMDKILKSLDISLREFKNRQRDIYEPKPEPEQQVTPIPSWQQSDWYQKQLQYSQASAKRSWKEQIPGGRAEGKTPSDFNKKDVEKGKEIELEHTGDTKNKMNHDKHKSNHDLAREIAIDHLDEFDKYYDDKVGLPAMEDKLKKLEENKDARGGYRGLYGLPEGNEHNPDAAQGVLDDWQFANAKELSIFKSMAQQRRFNDMVEYRAKLISEGFDKNLVDKLMTAAMHKVKL